ncbi:MAG: hypothetical protein NC099_00750 [Corallococcus sp.]|nr:hypothetical protein [Corallococcus sp.]
MKNIDEMLCYMDEEDVYELAKEVIDGGLDMELGRMLPYMDEEDVNELLSLALKRNFKCDVKEFLPYLDEEKVDEICEKIAADPEYAKDLTLDDVLPYASEEGIDKLFTTYARQGKFEPKALPYVSEECLHRFVTEYCANPDFDVDIDVLYPYLESKDISLLFKTYLKKRKRQ